MNHMESLEDKLARAYACLLEFQVDHPERLTPEQAAGIYGQWKTRWDQDGDYDLAWAAATGGPVAAPQGSLAEKVSWLRDDLSRLRDEVETVVAHMPKESVVQCREGGGPEDLARTLAISVSKLAMLYESTRSGDELYRRGYEAMGAADISEYLALCGSAKTDSWFRHDAVHGMLGVQ